jgi:hypothetical protein
MAHTERRGLGHGAFRAARGQRFLLALESAACVSHERLRDGCTAKRYPSQFFITVILSVELPGQDSRCARRPGRILDTARSRRLFAVLTGIPSWAATSLMDISS